MPVDRAVREAVVDVSAAIWQLLKEYDVPATVTSVYKVHIETTRTTSKMVQLTLRGRNAEKVATMLADPPLKLEVPEGMSYWLMTDGPRGFRVKDILKRTGALVKLSKDKSSLLLVGSSESTLAAKGVNEGLRIERRQIPQAVCCWLTSPGKGVENARAMNLERKYDVCISMGPLHNDNDPARVVDLVIVGEREENVADVFAVVDRLHVKHCQIPQAVHGWLSNSSKGADCARSVELDRKFDTCIVMGQLSNDKDPARMVDFSVVGEHEENVDQVLAAIANIVVEMVNITELQAEFWMGHEDEENRSRPKHKLEDATDTYIGRDEGAGYLHVAGRPDCVRAVVERINKTQHIALRTSVVSFAMANYIGRARRPYENDNRQIHLAAEGMQPGTWELRCLYVVAGQDDDAGKIHDDLMRKLDLDEVVLEVPMWAQFLVRKRGEMKEPIVHKMEKSTGTGIGFSTDAVYGRVIVAVAGSTSTVKQGIKEVIRRLEGHAQYREGDICLRRIQGQSVDTAGFKKTVHAKPLNLSSCKEPFDWDRLTRERWCYVGAPLGGRPTKRSRQPSV